MPHSPNGTEKKVSRAEAIRQARAAKTSEFPLPNSGGIIAQVRRLTLNELIALDAIPTSSQEAVNRFLESMATADGGIDTSDTKALFRSMGGAIAGIKMAADMADAAVLLGFIDPQVVRFEELITDRNKQVTLADIDPVDRQEFWAWCQAQEETAAQAVAPVFSAQEQAGTAALRQIVDEVSGAQPD